MTDDDHFEHVKVDLYGVDAMEAILLALASQPGAFKVQFAATTAVDDPLDVRVLIRVGETVGVLNVAQARTFANLHEEAANNNPTGKRANLARGFSESLRVAADMAEKLQHETATRN